MMMNEVRIVDDEYEKNRTRGTYDQLFMTFNTHYFSINTGQQKTLGKFFSSPKL